MWRGGFHGHQHSVAKLALLNCGERNLRQLFRNGEVNTGQDEFLQAYKDFGTQQLHANLVSHFEEGFIVKLHLFQFESCRTQESSVTINRLSIGDAGDPGEQALQLLRERGPAREVAKTYAPARAQRAREFLSGTRLIWERTEGAFANDGVERVVRGGQAFGITPLKPYNR